MMNWVEIVLIPFLSGISLAAKIIGVLAGFYFVMTLFATLGLFCSCFSKKGKGQKRNAKQTNRDGDGEK